MKLKTEIHHISAEVKGNIIVIWSETPLRVLSSAVLNGGLQEANGIINVQVPEGCGNDKRDVHWNAEEFLIKEAKRLQLPDNKVIGLMTAAKMGNVVKCSEKCVETTLTVFVTAGSTVAVAAGEVAASIKDFQPGKYGTINVVLLVDGNLTESCMVDALKTVTEAKTVALRELDIRSRFSGDIASGTLTDSVLVGCTGKGEVIQYAGTFTLLGELIGKCVRDSVKKAIFKQENILPNRSLMTRLAEREISIETIMSLLPEPKDAYERHRYQQLKKQVELFLSDKKIASLVLAGLRFDDDVGKSLIPANASIAIDLTAFEEIIQVALKDYFSDTKKEPATEERLGQFTKGVFKAILKKATQNISNC